MDLEPFDEDVIATVARETDSTTDAVRQLVGRHQRLVRENPGVTDLVYEWRNYLEYDPLVARTDDAYYLVVLPRIWAEFGEALDLSSAELDRLELVHDRQARRNARERGDDESVYDGARPVVLERE